MKLEVGQEWEEVDSRRAAPRRFVIVEFVPGAPEGVVDVGCVRFFGLRGTMLSPNPGTGRRPRRFKLHERDFEGRRYRFTGRVIEVPEGLGAYPPTKSYGL